MKWIKVSPGFIAAVCILLWYDRQIGAGFLLGIFCHELGHLAVMKICRTPVTELSLRFSGAVIQGQFRGYGQELACALAGPAASIMMSAITLRDIPEFAVINGLLAAVNLLPMYPLDGGRILRSTLHMWCDDERVERWIKNATYCTCGLLMLLACWLTAVRQAGIWPIFAALIILYRVGKANLTG